VWPLGSRRRAGQHGPDQGVTYPIAKVPSSTARAYTVQGIPQAAVVKDGEVLWLGHPAMVDDDMISGWLAD